MGNQSCAASKGYKCEEVGYTNKCVSNNNSLDLSIAGIKQHIVAKNDSANCSTNSQCEKGFVCFKAGFQPTGNKTGAKTSGVCLKSYGTCYADCDCLDVRMICHGPKGAIGNCFCNRVNQTLCGNFCKKNEDCDSCSICLSGMCTSTPGIQGCEPLAKTNCTLSPKEVCRPRALKECCTDCDCVSSCSGSFCHPCKGICIGPKPWNCEDSKTRSSEASKKKAVGGLCHANSTTHCPKNHCCKSGICTPYQMCQSHARSSTDSCNAKEVSIAYINNPSTKEVDCACSCDGTEPASTARASTTTLSQTIAKPAAVPSSAGAGGSEVDLGEYFDGTSKRKKRQSNKKLSLINSATNAPDFVPTSVGSLHECAKKVDSSVEIEYDLEGNCKCYCNKGQDGGWSSWEEWSECSASCSGGTRSKTRSCNNPTALGNGAPCIGSDKISELCKTNPCPCCNCTNIRIEPDTCIQCEVQDIKGIYINQGVDSNKETCSYSKTAEGRTLELISHPERKGWGVLLGKKTLAFGRVQAKDKSPQCPVGWSPLRDWQSLTKKDAADVAIYIGSMEIGCENDKMKESNKMKSHSRGRNNVDKKVSNEVKMVNRNALSAPKNELGSCCSTLVLSYDPCLDCFYDGYDGQYKRQSSFYLNIDKNLFLYTNPRGTWTVGSTLDTEGVASLRSTTCPEDKNIWQFYHPDLKSLQPVQTFTVKCQN